MSEQKPTVKKVPWSSASGVVTAIVLFFAAQFVASILVLFVPLILGWSEARIDSWLTGSVYGNFVFVLIAQALTFGGVYLFLKYHKQKLSSIGLVKPQSVDVLRALLGYGLYFVAYLIVFVCVSLFIPAVDTDQEQQTGFNDAVGFLPLIITFIALVILPPLVEEIVVRGLVFTSFRKRLPVFAAVMATSFLFAIAHLPAGGPAGPLYIAAIDTFVLSVF